MTETGELAPVYMFETDTTTFSNQFMVLVHVIAILCNFVLALSFGDETNMYVLLFWVLSVCIKWLRMRYANTVSPCDKFIPNLTMTFVLS